MEKFDKIRWVIQKNLLAENDLNQLQEACKDINVEFENVTVIPFSPELPSFTMDEKTNIYFGSTTLVANLYKKHKPVGVFFDEATFSMENYLSIWGKHMLSYGAKVTTLKELTQEDRDDEDFVFIRPDADDKSFNGEVWRFGDIKNWRSRLICFDNVNLSEDTKIIAAEAYNIEKEWRNFVVDGEVVSSSLYRKNFRLNKSNTDTPEEMIKFVEARIAEYSPSSCFVMDIALCGGEYFIIECGNINSVGFYASDIKKIVRKITEFVAKSASEK